MDMRYYYRKDQVKQKHFSVTWQPGTENDADYFRKHHTPSHHQKMRKKYLLQGCIVKHTGTARAYPRISKTQQPPITTEYNYVNYVSNQSVKGKKVSTYGYVKTTGASQITK